MSIDKNSLTEYLLTQGPERNPINTVYPLFIAKFVSYYLIILHVQENDKLVEEVHVPHQPDRMV